MNINDTRIETAGVFRCCLSTIGEEYIGSFVDIGNVSCCQHCKRKFVLTGAIPNDAFPIWKPEGTSAPAYSPFEDH